MMKLKIAELEKTWDDVSTNQNRLKRCRKMAAQGQITTSLFSHLPCPSKRRSLCADAQRVIMDIVGRFSLLTFSPVAWCCSSKQWDGSVVALHLFCTPREDRGWVFIHGALHGNSANAGYAIRLDDHRIKHDQGLHPRAPGIVTHLVGVFLPGAPMVR